MIELARAVLEWWEDQPQDPKPRFVQLAQNEAERVLDDDGKCRHCGGWGHATGCAMCGTTCMGS